MSRVNDFEENMKDIFETMDDKRQQDIDLLEELKYENKLLWATIDRIKKEVNKI